MIENYNEFASAPTECYRSGLALLSSMTFDEYQPARNKKLSGEPNTSRLERNTNQFNSGVRVKAYDADVWSEEGHVPFKINADKPIDLIAAGLVDPDDAIPVNMYRPDMIKRREPIAYIHPKEPQAPSYKICNDCGDDFDAPQSNFTPRHYGNREPYIPSASANTRYSGANDINGPYHPDNKQYMLPVNFMGGDGMRSSGMNAWNKELFTTPVDGTGLVMSTEVLEPINHMKGVSFNQETIPSQRVGNEIRYMDPRTYEAPPIPIYAQEPAMDNVYDPRSYGYGSSYRHYIEPVTNQPRYYYDDIDSIRKPSMLCRSNIQHLEDSQRTGPITYDVPSLRDIKIKAHTSFIDGTNDMRQEYMKQAVKRYNNGPRWQTKLAPVHTYM